jgi:hypothetical protein
MQYMLTYFNLLSALMVKIDLAIHHSGTRV